MTFNITPAPHNSAQLTHPQYRPDIDGLRAIAVLSVVCFHAFPYLLNGGFIGVDIFFVISGYLISTIIFDNLERSSFSFVEFYVRRIKRIFPALLLVLIACFAFGWFELLADEYKQLGKHIAGGAGFVSNLILWNESGYFDTAADTKPLLHLWSLGIEEQFYIIWPLLLWFTWKRRLNFLTIAIVVGSISFALNIANLHRDLVATFYSPQTRFWELMAGSVLAYMTLHKQNLFPNFKRRLDTWLGKVVYAQAPEANGQTLRDIQSSLGALLIAIGLIVIDKDRYFPGGWALLPTLGAALIISAGGQAWLNRTVLSNRVLVWFGLISFPLYLWHWPLLSFAHIVESESPSDELLMAAVLCSIALAWLTYRLIEKPIRFGKYSNAKAIVLVVLMIIVGCVGYNSFDREGLPFRSVAQSTKSAMAELQQQHIEQLNGYGSKSGSVSCFQISEKSTDWFVERNCLNIKYPGRPKVFLIGDSHSASLSIGLRSLAEEYKLNFLQMSSGWCAPFSNANDDADHHCHDMHQFVSRQIESVKPDVLIIDAFWLNDSRPPWFVGTEEFLPYLQEKINSLKSLGARNVIVTGQIPTWKTYLPKILARRYAMKNKPVPARTFLDIDPESLHMDSRMKQIAWTNGVIYLSLKDALCDDTGCLTNIGPNLGTDLIAWDYGHLTPAGSKFVTDRVIKRTLLDLLKINQKELR